MILLLLILTSTIEAEEPALHRAAPGREWAAALGSQAEEVARLLETKLGEDGLQPWGSVSVYVRSSVGSLPI